MFSLYQKHLLNYFRDYAPAFLHFIIENSTQKATYINSFDNIEQNMVKFLDQTLRQDMNLYSEHSVGWNHHQDMLIEIHLPMPQAFKDELFKDLNAAFVI
jgi:hypothetical protein